jgi:hypothetical protein
MRIFYFLIAVGLFSCKQQSKTAAAEFDTKKIQTEIQAVVAQIFDAAAHVDSTRLYEVFSFADPDFTYIEINGVFYDVVAYKKMVGEFYGPLKSEILKKGVEKFIFFNENNVLWSYSGGVTATYKDGKQEVYDPFGMTMLFRKTNDKWKVVFLQESTQPPRVYNQ